MPKNNRVIVVEDDPYARDLILKLLSRDWRTRVAGEFDSFAADAFHAFLTNPVNKIDTVILDTEVPGNPDWPLQAFEIIGKLQKPPKLILLCTLPVARYWNDQLLDAPFFGGYLLKQEILYSIATAVSLAAQGSIVLTPAVAALGAPVQPRDNMLVVDGSKIIHGFTQREQEVLRLGILFNHSQRDMEDELVISRDWASKVLSSIYEKLQLKEIITGELPLDAIFPDKVVLTRVQKIVADYAAKEAGDNLRRTPWLMTLAFHLLTIPQVSKWSRAM
ncbi:MAG: hypothetical protein OEZ02_07280 [Anaerolineae bacterium]|nr:hypothetical protein [Anaerolineae bacterium]